VTKKRVLFVCSGNSARSLIAEALLRHRAGEKFEVFSAGTRPSGVDPKTLEALDAHEIPTRGLRSKSLASIEGEHFDFVITLCSKAAEECRPWQGSGVLIDWDFPDPLNSNDPMAFGHTVREIAERINLFVLVNSEHVESSLNPVAPVDFFKSLADETRLLTMLLIERQQELCVCDLVEAMCESQPKISRHLRLLRKVGLLSDRRQGQWVFYRLSPGLEAWMVDVLKRARENNGELLKTPLANLKASSRSVSCG